MNQLGGHLPVALTDIMQMSNAAMPNVKQKINQKKKKSTEKAMFLPCCAIILYHPSVLLTLSGQYEVSTTLNYL